uniref:Uncharacterized protein n=1 Tax=Oryza brachyantha TaxID=4533 RepID=J3M5B6_ORYBR
MSEQRREERNRKQHEYRAKKRAEVNNVDGNTMSDTSMQPTTISSLLSESDNVRQSQKSEEQREDRNRKQRIYRARKKA